MNGNSNSLCLREKKKLPINFNRAFTLLELIVVIVIIGILATLGFTQYTKVIEKGRQAEARAIIGTLRKNVIAYYMVNATTIMSDADAGISTGSVPKSPIAGGTCDTNHYYGYYFYSNAGDGMGGINYYTLSAIRCTSGGKSPQGTSDFSIGWKENLQNGLNGWGESDTWASRSW